MTYQRTATRQEWLSARLELLDAEKEHTRRGDDLDVLVGFVEPGYVGYAPGLPPDAPPAPRPGGGAIPGDLEP